jgi:hypothetical protein
MIKCRLAHRVKIHLRGTVSEDVNLVHLPHKEVQCTLCKPESFGVPKQLENTTKLLE